MTPWKDSRPELLANPWKDSGLTERALNEFVNFQLEGHIYIWLEKLPRFQYQYFFSQIQSFLQHYCADHGDILLSVLIRASFLKKKDTDHEQVSD